MKLENLVADRELCEKIPADDFLDAAFCWHFTEVAGFVCRTSGCEQFSGKQWMLERSTSGKIVRYRQKGEQIFPAPTLREVLGQLPIPHSYTFGVNAQHCVETTIQESYYSKQDIRRATAGHAYKPENIALELWLKMKGIAND